MATYHYTQLSCVPPSSLFFIVLATILSSGSFAEFIIKEATIDYIQASFRSNEISSRQLTEKYINEIDSINSRYFGVIEINPAAMAKADIADQERRVNQNVATGLHGIPILLKDNIATKDSLNTTSGSFALLGSVVPRDAGVVKLLRDAGAIILGKASLTEWDGFRSFDITPGWSPRGGQGVNPYNRLVTPCGSSSGSAISVATNMVTVSLGTETRGAIFCPASYNSVVGIKPTVALTSRAGVIPISGRQDSVGPICRTVTDAVYVLDAIVGEDFNDPATIEAAKYIPAGGYKHFLKADGLQGKRLGIARVFFDFGDENADIAQAFENHFDLLRQGGAILVDNLTLDGIDIIWNIFISGELTAMKAEFKIALNNYLQELQFSPVQSLKEIIAFNNKSTNEWPDVYDQSLLVAAEATDGIGPTEEEAIANLTRLSRDGFEKLMNENNLDALVTAINGGSAVLAIGGFPGINVPAGYNKDGMPFGINFGGLKGYEPRLIEIAYAFEQATKIRKPPPISVNILEDVAASFDHESLLSQI